MKKFIAIPLIFCLLILCSCSSLKITKETAHDSFGIAYDSITIKGPGAFMEEDLVITKDMDGGKVSEIAPYAFFECDKIESLKINGDLTIYDNAFSRCNNLKKVTLTGLDDIKDNAFYDCNNLEELIIDNCYSVCDGAFIGCENLKNVSINCSYCFVAFGGCPKLKTITIKGGTYQSRSLPSNIEEAIIFAGSFKDHAFNGCDNLERVTCTSTSVYFDRYAFEVCEKNITITYPGTKAVFKDHAREGLTTLLGGDITVKCTDGTLYYPSF